MAWKFHLNVRFHLHKTVTPCQTSLCAAYEFRRRFNSFSTGNSVKYLLLFTFWAPNLKQMTYDRFCPPTLVGVV